MKRSETTEFFNRELSWVQFNERVLREGLSPAVPLLERLKFLSIVSSNFDEFFMVRVAGLKRRVREGARSVDPSGMGPEEELKLVSSRVRELCAEQYRSLIDDILPGLAANGIRILEPAALSQAQTRFLEERFRQDIFPLLMPIGAEERDAFASVGNLRIHVAFLLEGPAGPRTAIVQVPPNVPRFVSLPADRGEACFALLEDVVAMFASELFHGYAVRERAVFKLTRDADFAVDEERDEDFVKAMEEVLSNRQRSAPVRLSVARGSGASLVAQLRAAFGLDPDDVYEFPGPVDLRSFMELSEQPGWRKLRDEEWTPIEDPELPPDGPLWDEIKRRDLLVFTPYESFGPVLRFLDGAADDPDVLAIKMTLYRTSGDSPIVRALERAAANGKQVMALVELKARFDEGRNISWAERLERAGAIVVYGVAKLKVHAKAALVVRREPDGVRRYLHLSTGNYNDRTARLYADLSLFTADDELCRDASFFFNAITGYSEAQPGHRLVMAPFHLKDKVISLIDREAARSTQEYPGLIMAKMNSLTDPDVIRALYRASRAGVAIRLNVRGICMLVPGRPGLSENIRVVSVVDRYLEHSRIFHFANGGASELYLSSADWMERNLERRVELLFPVRDEACSKKALDILKAYFRDNVKACRLSADGRWSRVEPKGGEAPFRAQEFFHAQAKNRAEALAREPRLRLEVRRGPNQAREGK